MKEIDIFSNEEIVLNGCVYTPLHGELSWDGGEGPTITVNYVYVRALKLGESKASLPPGSAHSRLNKFDDRLDHLESIVNGLRDALL
jgi:hypothetical protein